MRRALVALFVSFGFLAAGTTGCGKSEPQQGSGGSDAGAQGGTGGGTGGAAGSGGIVEAASCTGYDDELASAVTITYQNARQSNVYLVNFGYGCEPVIRFELANASGSVKPSLTGECLGTCAELQTSPTAGACDAGCMYPGVVVIAPGGSYHESWDGRIRSPMDMPKACYADPAQAPPSCPRLILAPSGDYTFDSKAGTSCDACNCTPSAEGWCIFKPQFGPDAGVGGETIVAEAPVTLPSAEIKLVFQ